MNFRRNRRPPLPAFQMTAMIDVVFLLLCFFITTSVFSQWEYEIAITLPTAQTGKIPDRLPGEIIINIDRSGAVSVNRAALSLDELKKRLVRLAAYFPGQPVVLRADKATSYENLIRVVDACRQADIWNFSLATREDESRPKKDPRP